MGRLIHSKTSIKQWTIQLIPFAVILLGLVGLINKHQAVFYGADWQRTGVFTKGIFESKELEWWKFETDGKVTSSPVIHKGVVYFGSWDSNLYAVDVKTGNTRWKFKTEGEVPFSPAIYKGKAYFTSTDGRLYVLDIKLGKRIWEFKLENLVKVSTSPVIVNGVIYFGSRDGNLYAVETKTGKEKWRYITQDFIDSSPAISYGMVYFGSFDGTFYAVDVKSGKEKWRFKTGGEVISSPALANGIVYFGTRDGNLYALDAITGEEKWRFETLGFVDSTPTVSRKTVYFGSRDGNLYALNVKTGKERWRFEAGNPVDTSPAVLEGLVYFGDFDGNFYAVDADNGKEEWRFETNGVILSSPSIAGKFVYFGSNDGNLYTLDVKTGKATPQGQLAISENAEVVGRFDVYELTIEHDDFAYLNPWEEVEVQVKFTSENGELTIINGFYYDDNHWKVRFSPDMEGKWTWDLIFSTPDESYPESGYFTVTESENRGFVRQHPDNPFRLVFEDGSLFNAVGIGNAILDKNDNGYPLDDWGFDGDVVDVPEKREWGKVYGSITDLDTYLKAYGAGGAGFNLFRWSVDNFSFKLWEEISEKGNRYRVKEGIWGDRLAVALKENGFRIWMTFFGFNPPFIEGSGNQEKREAIQRYVDYVVARYGPYVDIWELTNEVEISNEWVSFTANYLRLSDPYDHPITTSWEKPELDEIDINAPHWYEKESEFASDLRVSQEIKNAKQWGKPVVFAEQGNKETNWDETSALRMRLRAWTAFFEEGMLIFWNTSQIKNYKHEESANLYIGPEERNYISILQNFTQDVSPDIKKTGISVLGSGVRAYGLESSNEILGYLHHFSDHESSINAEIRLNIPKDGKIMWYNPETGDVIKSENVSQGSQILKTPEFFIDLAFKLRSDE